MALTKGFDLAFLAVAGAILAAVLISSRDSHEHSKAARSGEAGDADAAAVPVAADPSPSARGAPPLIDRRALRQTRLENPNMTDEFLEKR